MKSIEPSLQEIERLKAALEEADAIIIGAGAGLSTAAGFAYAGERFNRYFADFAKKYGFGDMYSGGFYPYATLEEYWAFWSVQININRYMNPPKPVYDRLLELVKDRNYFVLTTNVDHCFQKAGFNKARLFYTQGDFGLFQCGRPCRKETYDNEIAIKEMIARQKDLKIPSDLVPYCPHCGSPMTTNLRIDNAFVEDAGWHAASDRYTAFLRAHGGGKIALLELGVGYNTPGIIKYPFWELTAANPKAVYACINREETACPAEIGKQAIILNMDIGDALETLLKKPQV